MPKRTNDFQRLVYLIQKNLSDGSEVTESRMLRDRQTGTEREVDVVIEGKLSHQSVVISIECRDRKRRADVQWVEQMIAKHERLPTNVLLLASSSGYTAEAVRVAEAHGTGFFSLENQTEENVSELVGSAGSLWIKNYRLFPEAVRVEVAAVEDLDPETVVTMPDNLLYSRDGTELATLKKMVETLLEKEHVRRFMAKEGLENHRSFRVEWTAPTDSSDHVLYMMKLEPQVLRKVERIRIEGACEIAIAEFGLKSGAVGAVQFVWGKAKVAGQDAMAVATQTEDGQKRLSIHIEGSSTSAESA